VKTNLGKLLIFGAVLAALLVLTTAARADSTLYGKVWAGATSYPANLSTTPPSGTPDVTFAITNPTTSNMFGFYSQTDNDLTGFLTNGGTNGNVVTYLTGDNQNNVAEGCTVTPGGTCGINNDVIEFTGTTYMVNGQTYSLTKDDTAYLVIGGDPVVTALNDTAAETLFFTWGGATGTYAFDALYSEVNGAPATLKSDIAVTPEPGNMLLLGTGLLVAAFVFRRQVMGHAV